MYSHSPGSFCSLTDTSSFVIRAIVAKKRHRPRKDIHRVNNNMLWQSIMWQSDSTGN